MVVANGFLIYVVSRTDTFDPDSEYPQDALNTQLLEFRVSGDSLDHTLTVDVPPPNFACPVFIGHSSSFVYIKDQGSIFDAESRSFYKFPKFESLLVCRHHCAY